MIRLLPGWSGPEFLMIAKRIVLATASIVALVGCSAHAGRPTASEPVPAPLDMADWETPAEASGFTATPSYDETLAWLERLAAVAPQIQVQSFGRSALGRTMHVVVVSSDRAFDPVAAAATGKPIVLIQNGIHPGEIAGKDASLILLRELLVEGLHPEVLQQVILLIVPAYNVDGHERVGHSRINQDGPEQGMGFRTTSRGQDLNRDYMKLDSVEAQALVGGLIAGWEPHLLVDDHTTDGADHQYQLTYGIDRTPFASQASASWTQEHIERVAERMEGAGHPVAPYLFPVDRRDPSAGLRGGFSSPRFSTSYMSLRQRPAILVEAHSLKPYRTRVEATHDFLLFVLQDIAARPAALTATAASTGLQAGTPVPIRLTRSEESRPFLYRTYAAEVLDGEVSGEPYARYSSEPLDLDVPVFDHMEVELEVAAPVGYVVPPQYPEVVERLAFHGLTLWRIDEEIDLEVEMVRLEQVEFAGQPYQGRHRAEVAEWSVESGVTRTFPAGSYWIPLDQPAARIAVHLLEPCAPDSFFAWGFFSGVMERKEYFERYVMEPMAQQMLQDDPALREEFEQALAEDETFAGNGWARLEFFYRRTEHADPDWRLYPVARLRTPLPQDLQRSVAGAGAADRSLP